MSKLLIPKFEKIRSVSRQIPKWSDPNSIYFRLPDHYKTKQKEFLNSFPKPIHQKLIEKNYAVDIEHDIK